MSADAPAPPPETGPAAPAPVRPLLWKKLAIWALLTVVLYLATNFLLLIFVTFMLCYLSLGLVGVLMRRLSPGKERPWLRRSLAVAVVVMIPLVAIGGLALVALQFVGAAQNLSGWLADANAEDEVARVLQRYVGPAEFKQAYGGPGDPRYQNGLEEFRNSGQRYVSEYFAFPALESRLQGGFAKRDDDPERARFRARLLKEGASSKAFVDWFRTEKYPELKEQAKRQLA